MFLLAVNGAFMGSDPNRIDNTVTGIKKGTFILLVDFYSENFVFIEEQNHLSLRNER